MKFGVADYGMNVMFMRLAIVVLAVASCVSMSLIADESIPVKSGQTIAFLGDSITAAGKYPGGYCYLVIDGLKKGRMT